MNKATAEILVCGYIGADDEVNYKDFRNAILDCVSQGKKIKVVINSGGGSMPEGFAIYDLIQSLDIDIEILITGMAASMAGVLAIMGKSKPKMSPNATFMVHRPQVMAIGESDGLRNMADYMDKLEKKAVSIFVAKTGQTEDVVKGWMKPGVETWFTAEECEALGIAEIDSTLTAEKSPTNKFTNQKEAWAFYNSFNQQKSNTMKKNLITVLNLMKVTHTINEDTTDERAAELTGDIIKNQAAKIEALTIELTAQSDKRITDFLTTAEDAGKITADESKKYAVAMKVDFDSIAGLINKLPGREDVNNTLGKDKKEDEGTGDDRSKWTFRDWEMKDSAGLLKMKHSDTKKYEKLEKAFYGE